MKKSTLDYESVSAAKDKPMTDGREVWQPPQLNEIDYIKTQSQAGDGEDLNFSAAS